MLALCKRQRVWAGLCTNACIVAAGGGVCICVCLCGYMGGF